MIDLLPRLLLFESSFEYFDAIIFNGPRSPFVLEILDLFGINDKSIIMDGSTRITSHSLIAPSYIAKISHPNEFTLNELQKIYKYLPNKEQVFYEKIYISRLKASSRRITNEVELLLLLDSYGFKRLYLEEYTIVEQIKLFNNANMIVAPHGAGLSNIIFSKPNTIVLELLPYEEFSTTFLNLSKLNGLQYFSTNNKPININNDFVVDIMFLSDLLKELN